MENKMTSNPQDEMQMPEEIWYSQQTVNNNGKEYTIHFVSLTKTDENKTRYHIADGFEKYIADRVDERLKEISPRAVSGGEALEALKWAEHEISCAHERVLSRNMPYHIAVKSLNYAKMLNTLIQSATRQHPTPAQAQGESVTVEELVNPIGTAYRTAGNLDAKDWTHVFVSTLQALGYTVIKRTE